MHVLRHMIYNNPKQTRLDAFLATELPHNSRSKWQEYIKNGLIKVNGLVAKPKFLLSDGDDIEIDNNTQQQDCHPLTIIPLDIEIEIPFENENLMVVNKPAGLTTHPGCGNKDKTLVNALIGKHNLSSHGGPERLGIVHRLDKDTSGLIIVAKNNNAHRNIASQIETRNCKRKYIAVCHGMFAPTSGTITSYIGPKKDNHKKMIATQEPGTSKKNRIAITNYKTLKVFCGGTASLVEFSLETGRTHQIRAHCLYHKHPIVGDQTYSSEQYRYGLAKISQRQREMVTTFPRQALHSAHLRFSDPVSNKEIEVACELPEDISKLVEALSLAD